MRMATVLLSLALALGSVELGLGMIDATFAAVGLRRIPVLDAPRLPLGYDRPSLDRVAAGQAYVMFDADLGWVPTPGFDRARGEVRYRHNRDGLRADRDHTPTPAAGTRRIAAYGDSFTYCEEVDVADCWTRRLEELLPASEVLNFGVPGYAPDQAWLRYQRDGAAWRPCAVLIGHTLENINRVVNRFRPFYQPATGIWLAKPRYVVEDHRPVLLPTGVRSIDDLRDPSWVETNLGPRDPWYFPGTFLAHPLDRLRLVSVLRTASYQLHRRGARQVYRPGAEGLEVLTAVLGAFAQQVAADGARPVVVLFPAHGAIAAQRAGAPKGHVALLESLRALGVPGIDLTDGLAAATADLPVDDLAPPYRHYTARGNTVVARVLAEQLPQLIAHPCGSG